MENATPDLYAKKAESKAAKAEFKLKGKSLKETTKATWKAKMKTAWKESKKEGLKAEWKVGKKAEFKAKWKEPLKAEKLSGSEG